MLMQKDEEYGLKLKRYRAKPIDYFVERLGVKADTIDWSLLPEYGSHIYDGTNNPFMVMLKGLVNNHWVGVESATGTGKTYNAALVVLWFLECFENSVVVTTAPKQDQLILHVWKEIGKLFNTFNKGILTQLKLRMNEGLDDWIAIGFVAGIDATEESATKAQGFHAEHLLIILEETPGIPLPVINAFFNTCVSPHNLILALGNPDNQMDNLHKFCLLDNVDYIRISAYDHPNIVLDNPNFIAGACSRESIERIKNRYGAEHPLSMSRTRGISPRQSVDSLIQLSWILGANEKHKQVITPTGAKALGVDVANSIGGDKASLAFGIGNTCVYVKDFQCPDANQLGKRDVAAIIKEENIKPMMVGVDSVGVGAGTVNALKEVGINVCSLAGGNKPIYSDGEEKFNNLRSQMYWQLREDLRNGLICLPADNELYADLTTPKWVTRNGYIIVETKEEIKKRLGHSPNKGDSVVYWNWVRSQRYKQAKLKVY